ncbi:MAG: HipA domain-containing protein [Clostridiales bacterium]|nr:HipA domain-containing protein [Clostridiales bacterium]MDD7507084.1 HipA domain-containing protein [Clostridiales bacterium]MDY5725835.1 HipA domain-containing protein [Eubacteriales bacterium]
MKCLCCGKEFTPKASIEELESGWHKKCVKAFFGSSKLPLLDISEETLKRLADESTNKGFTVPGVQKKLSLHLTEGTSPRLTLVNYPTGYILKPQTEEYETQPEAEYLVMQMAKLVGIKTVPFALIKMNGQGELAYITKRIDRVNADGKMQMLAMEDFCQLEERLTEDKYKGSYERCAKVIKKYSSMAIFDLTELYLRLVFSFVIGNSDMHLKNFSMIEKAEGSGEYVLSSAYDLLPVNAIMPEDEEEFALTMCKKKRKIRRKDFLTFAEEIGIEKRSAEKLLVKVIKAKETLLSMTDESYLSELMKERLVKLIENRVESLQ